MSRIIGLATAVPPYTVTQRDAKEFATLLFSEALAKDARLLELFEHTAIDRRYLSAPMSWYSVDHSFEEKNQLYVEVSVKLGTEVALLALESAGLKPADIDHLIWISSTGIATPSIDARLMNTLGLRPNVRRTPIWGLGCAGGVAGLARANDFARADPKSRVLLVTSELCSLTFQRGDLSKKNLVAASLFGDGAAAVIVEGNQCGGRKNGPSIELVASSSHLWRDTLDVMGWTVDGQGLHVVFSRDIPTIVRDKMRPCIEAFLVEQGLTLGSLSHFVAHPGGAKVLHAYQDALKLESSALAHAGSVLRDYGNMSAPTCLFVLDRLQKSGELHAGETLALAALGPGFCAEFVLARVLSQ